MLVQVVHDVGRRQAVSVRMDGCGSARERTYQARSVSATLHACAKQPRGVCGRIAVEDFADRAEASLSRCGDETCEQGAGVLGIA